MLMEISTQWFCTPQTLCGITEIYSGAQAIAAMTQAESIPSVHKIFGPGMLCYCAKELAQQEGVAIDMPAWPEVLTQTLTLIPVPFSRFIGASRSMVTTGDLLTESQQLARPQ
jgi:hypothetical protein